MTLSCEFCELKFKDQGVWRHHYEVIHNITFLQCEFCSDEYPLQKELDKHVKERHTDWKNVRHECSFCPSTFKTAKSLRYHTRIRHTMPLKPFECQECGLTFAVKRSYMLHKKITHVALRYIKCDLCPKIFRRKDSLKRHKDVQHSSLYRRAKCPLCPNTYKYKEHLHTHLRQRHYSSAKKELATSKLLLDSSRNKCGICNVRFAEKSKLLEHLKDFHHKDIQVLHCLKCDAVFKLKESYHNHLLEEHGMTTNDQTVDSKDFLVSEVVDFETAMINDAELRQLMEVKKRQLAHQKTIIVIEYKTKKDNFDLEISDTEVSSIKEDIQMFFATLIGTFKRSQRKVEEMKLLSKPDKPAFEKYVSLPKIKDSKYEGTLETCKLEGSTAKLKVHNEIKLVPEQELVIENCFERGNNLTQKQKKTFNCFMCKELFDTEESLTLHQKVHVENKDASVQQEIKIKSKNLKTNTLNCKEHNAIFENDDVSNKHVELDHTQQFKCPNCPKAFKMRNHFMRHINSHHMNA